MNRRGLDEAIEAVVAEQSGEVGVIVKSRAVGGGCINDARIVQLDDGRLFFVKSNPRPLPRMFQCEADGLEAMAETGAIAVPRPLGCGEHPIPFIVMEAVEQGQQKGDFFERFGRAFAEMHRKGSADRFGFDHDNYIGSTEQPNSWRGDWPTFFAENRLLFQLELARKNGLSTPELDNVGDAVCRRLPELLAGSEEPPALLHGDLWGGNYLCNSQGDAVLIDPAVYYGHREADLAMTTLFGGFSPTFYAAYREAWPLAPGSEQRIALYTSYHLLNHLNLFGQSYLGQSITVLQRFAAEL